MDQRDELIEKLIQTQNAWISWARKHLVREGLIANDFVPSPTIAMDMLEEVLTRQVTSAPTPELDTDEYVFAMPNVDVLAKFQEGDTLPTAGDAINYMQSGGVVGLQGGVSPRRVILRRRIVDGVMQSTSIYSTGEWQSDPDFEALSDDPHAYVALGKGDHA